MPDRAKRCRWSAPSSTCARCTTSSSPNASPASGKEKRAGEAGAIDNDDDGVCDAQDVSGGVLANAPKFSGSLTTRYDHILSAGSTLYGQLSGRWQTEVQYTNEQQPTTIDDGYSIWDLRLGWIAADTRLEVAGYVKNLFAQNYADNLIPLSLVNDRRDVVHKLSMGSDRLYGLSMVYRW
jgi:hypothetical protein